MHKLASFIICQYIAEMYLINNSYKRICLYLGCLYLGWVIATYELNLWLN